MTDDRSGDGPFSYKQWDDKPTWMLDRGRDDHGMHPTNEHVHTGFHEALISRKDKVAQLTDASVAFITMKKHAGLMGAAKSLGGMAMKHPTAAGAAVGAAGGAVAGGPNHRLSGAVIGGGLGASAGHLASKMPAMAAKPATMPAAEMRTAGLANQSPEALSAAKAELSGGNKAIAGVGQGPVSPISAIGPHYAGPQTQVLPVQNSRVERGLASTVPAKGQRPEVGNPVENHMNQAMQNRYGQLVQQGLVAPENMAKGTSPGQLKTMSYMKKAASLPFIHADNSINATMGGELSAIKSAEVISELAQMAEHHPSGGRFRIPGMGAMVGVVDDLANLGRQRIQTMISNRQNKQQQQPKVAAAIPFAAKRALQSAAGWGAAGAITGGLSAKPGNRLRNAAIGGLAGAAGGSVAPMAEHQAGKLLKMASPYDATPLMDMKQRAAERFPEKVSPIEAIRTDFKSALQLIQDKVHDLSSIRSELAQPKIASAVAGIDYKEIASLGGMPKRLMTRNGMLAAGAGALVGGGLAYYSSRPKKEHGGRSQAEVDLAKRMAKQPEHPEGIKKTIGKHVLGLHHDVAEQMRKHPVSATMMGAGTGAGLALRIAPILGIK